MCVIAVKSVGGLKCFRRSVLWLPLEHIVPLAVGDRVWPGARTVLSGDY